MIDLLQFATLREAYIFGLQYEGKDIDYGEFRDQFNRRLAEIKALDAPQGDARAVQRDRGSLGGLRTDTNASADR